MGIDTPESRTRDKVEKLFGKAAKSHLKHLLSEGEITLVSHDKGKFGRILGELFVSHEETDEDWMDESEGHRTFEGQHRVSVNQQMINDHHAVEYTGENKDTTEATTFRTSKPFIREWNCYSRTGGRGIIMIITIMDCFYIMMIAVIFGFIIHLEVQIQTSKSHDGRTHQSFRQYERLL